MPKGEGTRAWRKSGRQRAGAKIADPQDLEGMVKAALLESQFPVGTIMTHRQSASRRCCPCQRLLKTAIRTSEGKTGDNASSQRNERDTSTILIRTTGVKRGIAYRARAPRQRSFRTRQRTGKPSTGAERRERSPTAKGSRFPNGKDAEVRVMRRADTILNEWRGKLESRMMRKYPVRFGGGLGEKAVRTSLVAYPTAIPPSMPPRGILPTSNCVSAASGRTACWWKRCCRC